MDSITCLQHVQKYRLTPDASAHLRLVYYKILYDKFQAVNVPCPSNPSPFSLNTFKYMSWYQMTCNRNMKNIKSIQQLGLTMADLKNRAREKAPAQRSVYEMSYCARGCLTER